MVSATTERLRVAQVSIRDFKCISAVDITPDGDVITIAGDVGQGKTSILDAIETALRGGDETLVRRGADYSTLFVRVGDLDVNRTIHADGSEKLAVSQGGQALKVKEAKALLESIFGASVFRPIEWVLLSGGDSKGRTERLRRQRDELLQAIPLKLDEKAFVERLVALGPAVVEAFREVGLDIDLERQHGLLACQSLQKAYYDARTMVNKQITDMEASLRTLPVPPANVPKEPLEQLERVEKDLEQRWQRAMGADRAQAHSRARLEQLREAIATGTSSIDSLQRIDEDAIIAAGKEAESQIAALREQLAKLEAAQSGLRRDLMAAREANQQIDWKRRQLDRDRSELEDVERSLGQGVEDVGALQRQVDVARDAKSARALSDRHNAEAAKLKAAVARSKALDQLVTLCRDELPAELLKSAELPLPDLGIDGDQVTIGGVPIHRLGTSEQIRAGVRIAAAIYRHTGFINVDRAESLGRQGCQDLAKFAAEANLQLWKTEVNEHPEPGSIVMRGGEAYIA